MKRIIIICEGQTEVEFCKDVLYPHFLSKVIIIQTPLIKKTGGGIVNWKVLKKEIEIHLKQDNTAVVTTFIDYYGTKDKHNFPKWEEAKTVVDISARMSFLEDAMSADIDDTLRYRFIAYIQLHEFEGLLFCNIDVFTNNFEENEFSDLKSLKKTIDDFPNPELINNSPETSPSKRLGKYVIGYNKVVYGATLATDIGLQNIRNKCPRFNDWIAKIEKI